MIYELMQAKSSTAILAGQVQNFTESKPSRLGQPSYPSAQHQARSMEHLQDIFAEPDSSLLLEESQKKEINFHMTRSSRSLDCTFHIFSP